MSGASSVFRRVRGWSVRVARLARRRRVDRDVDEAIESDLQIQIDEYVRDGMTPPEARRAALLAFGNVHLVRETAREQRGIPMIEDIVRDVRHGARMLKRSPVFATAIVLSLALGIGANTAIFSIVNALLLRPLAVHDPQALVHLTPGGGRTAWSNPLWEQIRQRDLFAGTAAFSPTELDLAEGGESRFVQGLWVSGSFFEMLGITPAQGRMLTASDDARAGGADGPVAVISHAFWQRQFAGAPDIVGRTLRLDRVTFHIVGVTPAAFTGPVPGRAFDVAVPIASQPLVLRRDRLDEPTWSWLTVMARLAPGQTVESAAAALHAMQPALRSATMPGGMRPEDAARYLTDPMEVRASPEGPSPVRRQYRVPLLVLTGVAALVLLIACVNVANLMLARASARVAEVSLRLAIGASRGRLLRQFFVESLMLSVAGAALGVLLAMWASRALLRQLSTSAGSVMLDVSLDWRVLGVTALVAAAVALFFGIVPALGVRRVRAVAALNERSAAAGAGRSGLPFGSPLIAAQVAICLTLVVAGGLFLQTFVSLAGRDPGFDADRVLLVDIDARRSARRGRERAMAYDRVLEDVRALPGVSAAALSAVTPVSANEWDTLIENPAGVSLPESERQVRQNLITPEWFDVYGVPLVAGRRFTAGDMGPGGTAVIVNETFARTFFPGRNPIGGQIREVSGGDEPPPALTIVGVVRDSVYLTLRDEPSPVFYGPVTPGPTLSLSVRAASGAPALLAPAVAAAVSAVDRDLSMRARPFADDIGVSIARERLLAWLSAAFGALGLLLAGLGLYGVVSYGVAVRRAEIGIRLALGARPRAILAMVMRSVALPVAVGLAAGLIVSAGVAQFAAALMYGVDARDPLTLAAAVAITIVAATLASWLPAHGATRINPAEILKR